MGAGRNLEEAHDEIVALVRSISMASHFSFARTYEEPIEPESGRAELPYATVSVDEEGLRIDQDDDTSIVLVVTETVRLCVPERSSKEASTTLVRDLLRATQDLVRTILNDRTDVVTLSGKVDAVRFGTPRFRYVVGKFGVATVPVELVMTLTVEGLGP